MTHALVLRHDGRAMVILDRDREWVFSADPLGRIIWVYTPETRYRRSRFDEWYVMKRARWTFLDPVDRHEVEEAVASWRPTWIRAYERATGPKGMGGPLVGALKVWVDRFMEFHREDAERFRSIYQHIPILPPDAYQSLYIQLSVGCPWNRCLFCNFYRDRDYRVPGDDELTRHLKLARSYWEGALGSRSGLFLGDANATALPTDTLRRRLRRVREAFPEKQFLSMYSFADFFSSRQRGGEDFAVLHELGLRRICFGAESGNPAPMEQIQKPVGGEDIVGVIQRAKEGGIEVSLIFIIGLGGRRYRDSHFGSSIRLVSRLRLERPDRIYLSPLALDSAPGYVEVAEQNDWGELSDEEIEVEMKRWEATISEVHPGVPISLYNIRKFTY